MPIAVVPTAVSTKLARRTLPPAGFSVPTPLFVLSRGSMHFIVTAIVLSGVTGKLCLNLEPRRRRGRFFSRCPRVQKDGAAARSNIFREKRRQLGRNFF